MGHDTITQTLYRQQKSKTMSQNTGKGFLFFYPSLDQFLPLCIIKISCFLSPQSNSMKGSLWSAKPSCKKIFPSCDGSRLCHYLARARNGILIEPETTRLPFMSCRRRCDIWTVSGGRGWCWQQRWWWWCGGGCMGRHAIHCWVVFSRLIECHLKICQWRQLRGRYPKWFTLYRLSSCNSHALHNKQVQLDTFTHRGGV